MNERLHSFLNEADGRPLVLLTGATGGLGAAVLPRLLRKRPEARIVMPIRAASETQLAARLDDLLRFADVPPHERPRLLALRGDLALERFRLDAASHAALAAACTDIFHLAADLRFDSPLAEARERNVASTARVVEFAHAANRHRLRRFNHVSTAYVCGDRRGLVHESELDVGQRCCNAYEQSKLEAERLVRAAAADVPTTVTRPSIIVGESGSGKIRNFYGLYGFLKLVAKGKMRVLPANGATRLDLVPMDYVADALVLLSALPGARGGTFHLAAGTRASLSIDGILECLRTAVFADAPQRVPPVVAPGALEARLGAGLARAFGKSALGKLLATYAPYLAHERDFDTAWTASLLESHGLHLAPAHEVLLASYRYACAQRFGDGERLAAGSGCGTDTSSDIGSEAEAAPRTAAPLLPSTALAPSLSA